MKRNKAFWARLSKEERARLVEIERDLADPDSDFRYSFYAGCWREERRSLIAKGEGDGA